MSPISHMVSRESTSVKPRLNHVEHPPEIGFSSSRPQQCCLYPFQACLNAATIALCWELWTSCRGGPLGILWCVTSLSASGPTCRPSKLSSDGFCWSPWTWCCLLGGKEGLWDVAVLNSATVVLPFPSPLFSFTFTLSSGGGQEG